MTLSGETMGRNRQSGLFLSIIFVISVSSSVFAVEPMLSSSQMNELVRRAQCEIKCTKAFATRTNRTLNSGEVVAQFNPSSDDYKQCESGCRNPFSKQGHFSEAFQQGLLFYWQDEKSAENMTSAKVTSVTLKCMTLPESDSINDQSPPLLSGLVVVGQEQPLSEPIRFIFEVRYRAFAPKSGAYEEQLLRFGSSDQPAIWIPKALVPTVQYRFVVTAVDVGGPVGAPVASDWIEVPPQSFELQPPANVSIKEQFVVDGRLNAKIGWSFGDLPFARRSCFYQIAWANEFQAPHTVDFAVDESDGYVLSNFQFEQNYTISLKSISTVERKVERLESDPVGTMLIAKSCRQLLGPNPAVCGLGMVVDFFLTKLDEQTASAFVSWTPVDSVQYIAGYLLYYRSLPVPGQKSCPLVLEEYELRLNATASSAILQLNKTSDGCEYVAQIVSFDDSYNSSPPAQLMFIYPKRRSGGDYFSSGTISVGTERTILFGTVTIIALVPVYYFTKSSPIIEPLFLESEPLNFYLRLIAIIGGILLATMAVLGLFLSCWRCRRWLSSKCDKWQAIVDKWNMHLLASKTNSSLEPNPLYRRLTVSKAVDVRNSVILQGVVELEEGRRLRGVCDDSLTVTVVPDSTLTSSTLTPGLRSASTPSIPSASTPSPSSRFPSTPFIPSTPMSITDGECMCFSAATFPERNRIGCGKFGDVYLLHCASLQCNVALKNFSQTETNEEYQQKEVVAAMALARAGHPNIVKMYGVMVTESNRVSGLVFEHCDGGDLKKYLTKTDLLMSSSLYEKSGAWESDFAVLLITLCRQISDAMAFISSRGYVHRDLAARNVLLSVTLQSAKLADFGMARRLNDSDIYRPLTDGVLPYKWMPPETFERILPDGSRRVGDFLKKSDVWSFGALLIEVVSLGKDPEVVTQSSGCHPTILKESPNRVLHSITSRRSELDKHLRNKLLPIIRDCWRWEEADRPTFQELTNRLFALLQ